METWYSRGLKFECTRCGACCRGEPGYVWVSGPEVIGIAGFLGSSVAAVESTYLRQVGARVSLIEKANGDCAFWEKGIGCRIYPVRPSQCRTFPFWKQNVAAEDAWQRLQKRCPGIGQGKLFKAEEIRKRAEKKS
jgi:Fe-S-cluster containining protein